MLKGEIKKRHENDQEMVKKRHENDKETICRLRKKIRKEQDTDEKENAQGIVCRWENKRQRNDMEKIKKRQRNGMENFA